MLRDLKPLAPSLTETRSGELKKRRRRNTKKQMGFTQVIA
jgi:hypothetical protein